MLNTFIDNSAAYMEDKMRTIHTSDIPGDSKITIVHLDPTSPSFEFMSMRGRAVITTGRMTGGWIQTFREVRDQGISEAQSDCRVEELEGVRCTYESFSKALETCESIVIAVRMLSENLGNSTANAHDTLKMFLGGEHDDGDEARENDEDKEDDEDDESRFGSNLGGDLIEKELAAMLKQKTKTQSDEPKPPRSRKAKIRLSLGCSDFIKESPTRCDMPESPTRCDMTLCSKNACVKQLDEPMSYREQFQHEVSHCAGLAIVSCSSVNLVLSVSKGDGILFLRNPSGWSPPINVHFSKRGMGLTFGGGITEHVVLLTSEAVSTLKKNSKVSSYPDLIEASSKYSFEPTDDLSVFTLSRGTFTGMGVSSSTLAFREGINEWIYGVRKQREVTMTEVLEWQSKGEIEVSEAAPLYDLLKHCETELRVRSVSIPTCILHNELSGGSELPNTQEVKEFTTAFVEFLTCGIIVEDLKGGRALLQFKKGKILLDGIGSSISNIQYINHQFSHTSELPDTATTSEICRLLEVLFSSTGSTSSIVFLAPTIEATILIKLGLKAMEASPELVYVPSMSKHDSGWINVSPVMQRAIGRITADFGFLGLRLLLLDVRSPVLETWREAKGHQEQSVGGWFDMESSGHCSTRSSTESIGSRGPGLNVAENMTGFSRNYHCCVQHSAVEGGNGDVQWIFLSQEITVPQDSKKNGGELTVVYAFEQGDFKCEVKVDVSADSDVKSTIEVSAEIFQLTQLPENTEKVLDQDALWAVEQTIRKTFGFNSSGFLGIIRNLLFQNKLVDVEDCDNEDDSIKGGFERGIFSDRDFTPCSEPPSPQNPPRKPPPSNIPTPPPNEPDKNIPPAPERETEYVHINQISSSERERIDAQRSLSSDSEEEELFGFIALKAGGAGEAGEAWEAGEDVGEGEGGERMGGESKPSSAGILYESELHSNPELIEDQFQNVSMLSEDTETTEPPELTRVMVKPFPKVPLSLLPVFNESEEDDSSAVTQLERAQKKKQVKRLMMRLGINSETLV